jgi:hypothetical protein
MNPTAVNPNPFGSLFSRVRLQRGLLFGIIIITALLAFEFFNYSTTDFALSDLLGDLEFLGIRWATILAIAFCGIDFAGIARLFTPEQGSDEPKEVWYLFAAWLLAATMNALLTWWGVSIALLNHESLGNTVISQEQLLRIVPIFVAVMVWLIRVLIIGTFSVAGDRLFSQAAQGDTMFKRTATTFRSLSHPQKSPSSQPAVSRPSLFKPAPKPNPMPDASFSRPEPTYHPTAISARPPNGSSNGMKG